MLLDTFMDDFSSMTADETRNTSSWNIAQLQA